MGKKALEMKMKKIVASYDLVKNLIYENARLNRSEEGKLS